MRSLFTWLRALFTSGPALLSPTIRCEVVILFDASLKWTAHEERVELTPEERQRVCIGLIEAVTEISRRWGVPLWVREEQVR